jgi:hypothetical protein
VPRRTYRFTVRVVLSFTWYFTRTRPLFHSRTVVFLISSSFLATSCYYKIAACYEYNPRQFLQFLSISNLVIWQIFTAAVRVLYHGSCDGYAGRAHWMVPTITYWLTNNNHWVVLLHEIHLYNMVVAMLIGFNAYMNIPHNCCTRTTPNARRDQFYCTSCASLVHRACRVTFAPSRVRCLYVNLDFFPTRWYEVIKKNQPILHLLKENVNSEKYL